MVTIKSYTDLSQSKRLAEFLPIESADGYWFKGFPAQPYMVYTAGTPNPGEHIPCWSLAALFEALPKTIGTYSKMMSYFDDAYHCDYIDEDGECIGFDTMADNLVDACVTMIEKLYNEKLL